MDDKQEQTSPKVQNHKLLMSRMALNDNKAGMKGLDKEKINKYVVGFLLPV